MHALGGQRLVSTLSQLLLQFPQIVRCAGFEAREADPIDPCRTFVGRDPFPGRL